jgi:signal transduction histidine kinase/CheY-like chemotaxis protein
MRLSKESWRTWLPVAACGAAGILLSAWGYSILSRAQRQEKRSSFERSTDNRIAAIRREIESSVAEARSFQALYAIHGKVTAGEFRAYAHAMGGGGGEAGPRRPPVVEWIPRVPASARVLFERSLSREMGTAVRIWDGGPEGRRQPAAARPEYHPVAYVEPPETGFGAVGLDMGGHDGVAILKRTRDGGQAAAVMPWLPGWDHRGSPGLAIVGPVYRGQAPLETVEQRRAAIEGHIVVVRELDEVVRSALSTLGPRAIDLRFEDASAEAQAPPLYTHVSAVQPVPGRWLPHWWERLEYARTLDLSGVTWRVVAVSAPAFFDDDGADIWAPLAVLALSLLITAGAMAAAYAIQSRARRMKRLVARQTEELLRANRQLGREVSFRREAQQSLTEAHRQASESSRFKSHFLANMSHQLRTPLNGIVGMNDLMLATEMSPEQREYAESVRGCTDSLLHLLNDVLDLARLEAGKVSIEHRDFSICELVEGAIEMVAPAAQGKALELAAYVPSRLPRLISGDAARIRQVLLNLLSNAVEFTAQGGVEVTVSEEPAVVEPARNITLRFTVRDTGRGISRDEKVRLFRRFSKIDNGAARSSSAEGAGLGLAISRELVELMGGVIGVESEPGCGSVFWFTVRADRLADPGGAAEPRHTTGRILLAGLDPFTRRALERYLSDWGWSVAILPSKDNLSRHLTRVSYTVAIADGRLAPAAGSGATVGAPMALSSSSPGSATPVIWVQQWAAALSEDNGLSAGPAAADTLVRPVRRARLEALLRTFAVGVGTTEAAVPAAEPAANCRRKLKVLLAEDNPVNQRVACLMLEKLGHQVERAANGREAVDAALAGSFDVILMDCQMPEMDGYEATTEIRLRQTGTDRTPIIAITACAMHGDRERCLCAGMDDYLPKPLETGDLLRALELHTAAHRSPAPTLA